MRTRGDSRTASAGAVVDALESRRMLAATLPAGFKETQVVTGLAEVTSMAFAPDGRLFVTELDGRVRIIKNGQKLATPFLTRSVDRYNNRGLIGLAFDPNFASNRYLYVFYSRPDPSNPNVKVNNSANRVSRFRASATNPDVVESGSEVVLLDNIPNPNGGHNGGALHFGTDGMLYVTVGESSVPERAQDLNSLGGKVLRLNVRNYPNSIIPSDNPFVGQAGKRPEIWAYGFRHPYTAAIHPTTGKYFVNDVGGDLVEEINEVQKGKNYGWNKVEGPSSNTAYTNPIHNYSHNGSGAAIVGGTFYTGTRFPSQYHNQYFFADFEDDYVKVLNPGTKAVSNFATGLRAPIDLDVGPDGALYYLAYNDRYSTADDRSVYKFEYVGSGNRAPTAEYTVNPTSGTAPMAVTFDASRSSDPDGNALTYLWEFGNGATSTQKVVTHTYATRGQFVPKLTVRDTAGLSHTVTLPTIDSDNAPPTGTITTPDASRTYRAGDTISFSGTATDPENGTLAASNFSWSIRLFHNTHSHPFLDFEDVSSGSFTIPNDPPEETAPDQWYRVTLTVRDSRGAAHSSFVDVTPLKSNVTLNTNVPGLTLELDGLTVPAGHTFTGVENATRTIGVAAVQTAGGKWYEFQSWSDGGAATHKIFTPVDDATYTANFVEIPAPAGGTVFASADATVRGGANADTNYGSAADLFVKRSALSADNTRETFLKFDTAGLPGNVTAKVRMFGYLNSTTGTNIPAAIYPVSNTTWGENTITYNTRPASGTSALATTTVMNTTPRWYEWDVSSYVNAEKAAGRSVVSFAVRATTTSDPILTFGSDESANRPELVLTPKPPSNDVNLSAVADATVRDGTFGGTNYGTDTTLMSKRSSTVGNSREAYLQFDLTSVATINTAKLRLWGVLTNVDGTSTQTAVYGASETSWTESGLTYDNRPTGLTAALATRTISGTTGQWYEWDISSYLQAEKAAGRNVVTLVLRNPTVGNPISTFNSDEAASNKPVLAIT